MRERLYKGVQGVFWHTNLTEIPYRDYRKKKNGGISQADQRENRRFFGL